MNETGNFEISLNNDWKAKKTKNSISHNTIIENYDFLK
jgi:hypothetical protein